MLTENEAEDATVEHYCSLEGPKTKQNLVFQSKTSFVVLIESATEDAKIKHLCCLEGPKPVQNSATHNLVVLIQNETEDGTVEHVWHLEGPNHGCFMSLAFAASS